ncbi:MAG TPA: hypothetical protein VMG12_21480 [Polyangiaceae bacterium]|nr:hypothetical protein [Polyangiaceae bacterium]
MTTRLASMLRRALCGRRALAIAVCSITVASASVGCAGSTQLRGGLVFDYPVYYLDAPPPRVHRYPSAYYRGRPAYLVDGRWYYSTPRGWVVFRREPRELRDYREARRGEPTERRYRTPSRRYEGPTERRHRESWDARRDQPTERRYRRVDPD